MNFLNFAPSRGVSLLRMVPMQHMDEVKQFLRESGIKYRITYRGPRNASVGDFRPKSTRQAGCLKKNATHFSAYKTY
jgi:intein/homing endonuclease